jgi:hypothetical protein
MRNGTSSNLLRPRCWYPTSYLKSTTLSHFNTCNGSRAGMMILFAGRLICAWAKEGVSFNYRVLERWLLPK